MATKKKEETKLTKNLGYYGEKFQNKFIKNLLNNPGDFEEICGYLHASDVDNPALQIIVQTMLDYRDKKGRPVTWKELEYALKEKVTTEEKEKEVKAAFKAVVEADDDAMDDVATIGITFLKQQEMRRILLSSISKLENDGYGTDSVENTIDKLRTIEKKTQAKYFSPYSLFEQVMSEGLDEKITTGIPELDIQMNGGLTRGTTGFLVAGTGAGKTTLMTRMATMIAATGYKVLYLSFEDKETDLMRKVYAAMTGLYSHSFTNNNPEAKQALADACKNNANFRNVCSKEERIRFLHLTNGETTVEELKTQVRSLMKATDFRPDVIFLDYMSCLQASSDKRMAITNEYQALERAIKKLDAFANEENIGLWVAQQTNRNGQTNENKYSPEANIQGSFRLLQTASAVLYLERVDAENDFNRANLMLRKCRGGELRNWNNIYLNNGTCQLDLSGAMNHFDPDSKFEALINGQ